MKYEVGDCVTIRNIAWYNANKDEDGDIYDNDCICFNKYISKDCGKECTVRAINGSTVEVFCGLNIWFLQEWMLEPEEEDKTKIDLSKNAIIDPPVKCWVKRDKENGKWEEAILLSIDHRDKNAYRLKMSVDSSVYFTYKSCILKDPNIPKERYIPYTYEDFPEFRDCWVRYKDSFAQFTIDTFNKHFIFIGKQDIGINYEDAFKDLEIVNSDRTTRPFGKLKEK